MDFKKLATLHDRLNRRMKCHFDAFFVDSPLTSMQALTLEYVMQNWKTRDVFPKDVESFLSIRGSSAFSLIDNLNRNGYLKRESIPDDGRYRRLIPTEKALALQDDISDRIRRYTQSLFEGIPEDDLRVFESVIRHLIKNAE